MKEYWMPFTVWERVADDEDRIQAVQRSSRHDVESWLEENYGLVEQLHFLHGDGRYDSIMEDRDDEQYYLYKVTDERLLALFLLRWA